MRKVEKVFLNGRYLSQPTTGVQRHAAELVRALDATCRGMGTEFDFALLAPPDSREESILREIPVRRVGRLRGQLWEQLDLPRYARDGVLLSFANTGPVVHARQAVTIHDASVFAVPKSYSPAFRAWYRILLPQIARSARRIATDSEFSRGELARWMGIDPDRIQVVMCGCEHILREPIDTSVLAVAGVEGRGYVLATGGYRPHKNLALVEEAVRRLGAEAPLLVVVGRPNPRVFAGGALASGAVTLDHVTDAQLRALYEHALCLVYPSWYEGFGLPPLEAMACGCPTIVARAGSLPEVCGSAAMYVEPHDPDELAAAIATLVRDEDARRELSRRGKRHASGFTWQAAAEGTLELLRHSRLHSSRNPGAD
ncbi:MAG: glycosyltransferase family 1 protein [Longimicrobiales bacterium]